MEEIQKDSLQPRRFPYQSLSEGLKKDLAKGECLHELFEAQVDLRPNAAALICENRILSYSELDAKANQLAHCLNLYGVVPGKLVALYFDRSELPIIAILGCLKAGAAYVPIDPAYPDERIRHIFQEAEPTIVLTEHALANRVSSLYSGNAIAIDVPHEMITKQPTWRLERENTGLKASDLCYVIYTSGTTGRPKGVMTEHRNTAFFTRSFNETCATGPDDRVYQGFSLGFDGSVEEIWMAYSNGSALVVGSKQTPRFGNELAEFLTKNGVTYFSTVPTLLSTMTIDIPTLKQLVVSGEVCPPEIVARWAKSGRILWNVYGPTECTVNTTAKICLPGKPITIGNPLAGYDTYILDEKRCPVNAGEKGELYIAGEGLCRGYLKQPELTAERFVTSPYIGGSNPTRLYRSGDLVRLNESGELEFFGRIDSQVKIRGYRVELAEIESILLEHDRIRSASVKLFERDGLQELAAFVVLHESDCPLDRMDVLTKLTARLPAYMIPGFLDVLGELPMLTSGKVDRSLLPPPISPLFAEHGETVEPETELEEKIAKTWGAVFGLNHISVEDDFFLHLGGHSLIAAQMVTKLRTELKLDVTVRDAYRYPSVRKLATYLSQKTKTENKVEIRSSKAVFESLSKRTRFITTTLQALSIYGMFGIGTSIFCAFIVTAVYAYQGRVSILGALELWILISILSWPVFLTASILSKWILIGRYKACEIPVWSLRYFRYWFAGRMQAMSGAGLFVGTPFMSIYLRLMGAKVGKNCHFDTGMFSCWDLISIGDNTSISADTQILGYRVENGMLRIGKAEIGSRCFIGAHSALGLNTKMGDDSRLDDQSLLPDDAVIEAGKSKRGSPALDAEVNVPELVQEEVGNFKKFSFGLLQIILVYALGYVAIIPAIPFFASYWFAYFDFGILGLSLALLLSVPLAVISTCLYTVFIKRLILSSATPGIYSIYSGFYIRKWLSDGLMRATRSFLLPVYTTLYLPPWLRMMGAKIGKRAELSTVWNFSPELIDIADESFFADGSMIGGKRVFNGAFEIGINKIGRRSFVGNSAILPVGRGLGDGCLLGVLSAPPAGEINVKNGTEWLGSPAFALPNRQKVENFGDVLTFAPSKKLYLQRALIDGLRILIPGYIALFAGIAGLALIYYSWENLGIAATFVLAPAFELFLGLCAILVVVALKKLIMGRFTPVIKPLWSMYVWLNEMVNGAYESVMAPFLTIFLGTPFVAPLLRLLGIKVGKHTYIETTLFSEFDLVEIGDYAALNAGAVIQNHLFEDRVMKSDYLKIGDECSVGNMSVVLYNTEMQTGSTIEPLSLLMKGESLSPFTRWYGIPIIQR